MGDEGARHLGQALKLNTVRFQLLIYSYEKLPFLFYIVTKKAQC